MNKEELYNLALSDVHKYNLLNEIFAIEDMRGAQRNYCFKVNGFISLDVLNRYVNKIDENTNLKQALNEIRKHINNNTMYFDSEYAKIYGELCDIPGAKDNRIPCIIGDEKLLEIIDKVLGEEK